MANRKYIVHIKPGVVIDGRELSTRGFIAVDVSDAIVSLRGETKAVTEAAWLKLLGKNELGEDINKKSPTRKIIMDEEQSRYERDRPEVYERFRLSVTITLVGMVHAIR